MRRFSLIFIAGVSGLVLGSGAASAFSEVNNTPDVPGTTVADAPASLNDAPRTPVPGELPALRMIDPSSAGPSDGEGTVLSIPGFGRIGTLPKLDFGLELLYGTPTEASPSVEMRDVPQTGPESKAQDDDVIIRGTLKHRF